MKNIKNFEDLNEANRDGTISPGEDKARAELLKEVEADLDKMIYHIKRQAFNIGGPYRTPGIMAEIKNIFKEKIDKLK